MAGRMIETEETLALLELPKPPTSPLYGVSE
jgi:hypothetical protein